MITLDLKNKEKQEKILKEICLVIRSRKSRLNDEEELYITAQMILNVVADNKEGAEDKGDIVLMS
jgi:hypothetical protein